MLSRTRRRGVWDDPPTGDLTPVSPQQLIELALTAFVLLAPLVMVAVLVSGLRRRDASADQPGAHLRRLLVADGIEVPVEQDHDRAVA